MLKRIHEFMSRGRSGRRNLFPIGVLIVCTALATVWDSFLLRPLDFRLAVREQNFNRQLDFNLSHVLDWSMQADGTTSSRSVEVGDKLRPGLYVWNVREGEEALGDLLDTAIRNRDPHVWASQDPSTEAQLAARFNSDPWIINLSFWEKLSAGRIAFSKYIEFVKEVFPNFLVVEPSFLNTTVLTGGRRPPQNTQIVPAGRFYDFSSFHSDFGLQMVPLEWASSDLATNVSTIVIRIHYGAVPNRPDHSLFVLPCAQEDSERHRSLCEPWLSDSRRHDVVCLSEKVFQSPNVSQIFRYLTQDYNRVVFENFNNRVKRYAGINHLEHLRWRPAWYETSKALRQILFDSNPYVAVNFRVGKFLHHKKSRRILKCARHVFKTAIAEAEARNIQHAFAALDVLAETDHRKYALVMASALAETIGEKMPVLVTRAPRGDSSTESTRLITTAPGRAILDLLFIANANLFVGSGAHSGFYRLGLESSNASKESQIEVFCMKDDDWNSHDLGGSDGRLLA